MMTHFVPLASAARKVQYEEPSRHHGLARRLASPPSPVPYQYADSPPHVQYFRRHSLAGQSQTC